MNERRSSIDERWKKRIINNEGKMRVRKCSKTIKHPPFSPGDDYPSNPHRTMSRVLCCFPLLTPLPSFPTSSLLGASPVVVFHPVPGKTSQSPKHPHSQSVSLIIFFCDLTNVSTGHKPSLFSGQPSIPVRGDTPSLMMIRIWSPGVESHESTAKKGQVIRNEENAVLNYSRWNCMLVPNGANWLATKLFFLGI